MSGETFQIAPTTGRDDNKEKNNNHDNDNKDDDDDDNDDQEHDDGLDNREDHDNRKDDIGNGLWHQPRRISHEQKETLLRSLKDYSQ